MKQAIILLLITGISFTGYSQDGNSSEQRLKLGFNFGVNYSNIQYEDVPVANGGEISNALGYQLGILMDYSLTERLSLNPRVEVAFNNGIIVFPGASETQRIHEVLPVGLDIMAYLTYKFGNGKIKPYVLFGPDVKLPYLENARSTYEFTTSTIVALDFGVGLDMASENHIFSPELRYSYGLTSLATPMTKPFRFHSISLVLNVL
jgi:hypothetical protein